MPHAGIPTVPSVWFRAAPSPRTRARCRRPQDLRAVLQSLQLKRSRRPTMPEKATIERARRKARQGKAPSTQAGEFVREEIHHVRAGKHGARNAKQAIAIGLSKARKAG